MDDILSGKIFCIIGKSGSGKDTVFRKLLNDESLRLRPVVTYTTRPPRKGETDGKDYHFIDLDRLDSLQKEGKVIELRKYDTVKGLWCYATVNDGQINLKNANYILITTLEAFRNLKTFFGEKCVLPIYIEVEDGTRLRRSIEREAKQKLPDYEELCRRFLADASDFSESMLKKSGITRYYQNMNLAECVNTIRKDIDQFITKSTY